ncbi:7433_t:CDS:2, partial [Acaulospora morrowiae]
VGFSAIARGILDIFSSIRHVNIHDKVKWQDLYKTLDRQVKKLQNAGLSRKKKSDYLTMEEIKAILDSPATSVLTAKELHIILGYSFHFYHLFVVVMLNKNHAGGVKNIHNNGYSNLIPPDDPNNDYTPYRNNKT